MDTDDPQRLSVLEEAGPIARRAGDLGRAQRITEEAHHLADTRLSFSPRRAALQRDLGGILREVGDPAKAIQLLDRARVALAGGLGMRHPQLVTMTLDRADLAWELGDKGYAARLYAARFEDLRSLYGPRIRGRYGPKSAAGSEPPRSPRVGVPVEAG